MPEPRRSIARGRDRGPRRLGAWPLAAALLVVATAAEAQPSGGRPAWVIPPGREEQAQALLGDLGFMRDLGGGYRFEKISLSGTEIVYTLAKDGHVAGSLLLGPAKGAAPGELVSASFVVRRRVDGDDPRIGAILDDAARTVTARDAGGFYVPVEEAVSGAVAGPDRRDRLDMARRVAVIAALTAAGLGAAVLTLRRLLPARVATDFKAIHLVPSCLQVAIFLYWSVYWPELHYYAPLILLQLVFAYLADAAVSLATRRQLVVGLAPIPIVLSVNLFIQFPPESPALSFAAILLALLSKALLRRGDGRHVFNPSGFGVAVVGVVNLVYPGLGSGDVAHWFALPPNMTELILLLALVPQILRPIALVSFSAVLGIWGFRQAVGFDFSLGLWPPVFLALALLATDPATIPRTGPGRVLFGAFFGAGMACGTMLLRRAGLTDFYAKVFPLPIANLLAPAFDRAGERAGALVGRWLSPRWNRVHVAAWVVFVVAVLSPMKPSLLAAKEHAEVGTEVIRRDAQGAVGCALNPTFCRPFSFVAEIGLWLRRGPAAPREPR